MNAIQIIGETWTLTEAWLWIRFRSAKAVVGYAGPLRAQEPFAAGELSYEDAVSELAVKLRSGALIARGCSTGEVQEIPHEHWRLAEWGPRRFNWISLPGHHWSDIELSGVEVLKFWQDPQGVAPAQHRRGPKPGRAFPHDALDEALEEGLRLGRFKLADSDGAIARELKKREPFNGWRDIRSHVSLAMEKFRRNSSK